ncbi:MAG: RHS repeat protein [Caulobacteraceae bacterium]|nr:RHS repeat protein [Caulobacteraceae bacterium]
MTRRTHWIRGGLVSAVLIVILSPSLVLAAVTVIYTYDTLGRIATVANSSGVLVRYTYDSAGNRVAQSTTPPHGSKVWGSFTWGAVSW